MHGGDPAAVGVNLDPVGIDRIESRFGGECGSDLRQQAGKDRIIRIDDADDPARREVVTSRTPAFTAAASPALACRRTRASGQASASRAKVSSVEPSSTTTYRSQAASCAATERAVSAM
jgi:hypothetical protein